MLKPIDSWFANQSSCLQFLRKHMLDMGFTEAWKYGMPFYCLKGKMACYLWVHKKIHQPYLGIVEGAAIHHPDLLPEKRARMKILLIDPEKDIPVKKINAILKEVLKLY